jgi:2-polyprenyl-3-methyl-5-hydroxy-6-metoxy-1,4-benzoquinol methylase
MDKESYYNFYNQEYRPLYLGKECPTEEFFKNQKSRGEKIIKYLEFETKTKIKDKFILEIGTGAGGILKAFKDKGNTVLGIDIGNEYLEFGKKKNINLKAATIYEIPNIKPDIIIFSHVIEHLLDPIKDLIEIKKILKPETIVYVEVPGIKNLLRSYHLDFLRYIQLAHVYYFTLNSLNNVMEKAGYIKIAGNETIRAIYKTHIKEGTYKKDYAQTMSFLKELELSRSKSLFRLKYNIFSSIEYIASKTGASKFIQKASNIIK